MCSVPITALCHLLCIEALVQMVHCPFNGLYGYILFMKHIFLYAIAAGSALALGTAASAQPASAQTQQAAQQLASVSAHLKALTTMTADFVQTGQNGQTLSGALTLARPGKIRFQYEPGVPLLVVSDGTALTMIDYQVSQVSRWPIKSTPLGVLLDPERDPSKFARVLPSSDRSILLVEAKDPKHPEYGTITLSFRTSNKGPAGLILQGWSVIDAQNNRTMVTLSNQKFGVSVPANTFKFRDPRPRTTPRRG